MRLRYLQLGEQRGIGATMHVLEFWLMSYCLFRIVVDCGLGFLRGPDGINTQYEPISYLAGKRVDVIIVTHAHMDHMGAVPRVVAEHEEAQVIISRQALDGGTVLLEDGLRIQRRTAKELRRKLGKNARIPIIYDNEDLEKFLASEMLSVVEEPSWIPFEDQEGNNWEVGVYWAGHDQGAVSVFIRPPKDMFRPVWLTGDITSQKQYIADGVMLPPDWFLGDFLSQKNLVMISEGTNGNRTMAKSMDTLEKEYTESVRRTRARGGTSLTHTFSRGRSTNALHMLFNAGIWPVHVAGLSRKMVRKELPSWEKYVQEGKLIFIEEDREASQTHLRGLAKGDDSCGQTAPVIISPAATLDQGPAAGLAAMGILEGSNNSVYSIGHRFPDTVAQAIAKMERGRTITLKHDRKEVQVNVRCEVGHFGFSGHDFQKELVDRIELVDPQYLIVHHAPIEDDKPVGFQGLQTAVMQRMGPKAPHILYGSHDCQIDIE
ncbi:MAG: MBL fold metallo-hydrolase [Acidobacteria bacterium]|nr:MBL fold metallo-hydrolase [Acidobacteriota bacterium]